MPPIEKRYFAQARTGLARYFHFYNFKRPHQALDYQTPAQVYAVKDQAMLYSTLKRSPHRTVTPFRV